jgi:HK97 family phage prohead protease
MELGCISVPLELKFASEGSDLPAGAFEGYAAVFNNVDRGGDLIEPGAFGKSISMSDAMGCPPALYYNHDRSKGCVGRIDSISEDKKGLLVKGCINPDTQIGKDTLSNIKFGAIKAMSFGYQVPPGGYRRGSGKGGEPARYLKQVNLHEVSLVDDPMNPLAKLNFVKSARQDASPADEIKTLREFERFLRDVGGYSRAAAEQIATSGFKAQPEPRDEDDVGEHIRKRMQALADFLKS